MKAVILAGGAGTRLRPLTYVVPKCMLPIGGKPLIERTIQYLKAYGIREVVVCVAYLKKQIIATLNDGSSLGVKIEYADSDIPLGTAGQLKTAEQFIDSTFLLLNGDIVTSLNLRNLLYVHNEEHKRKRRLGRVADEEEEEEEQGGQITNNNNNIGTIALKKFEIKVPYGYIKRNQTGLIQRFDEKPTLSFMANAGIYAFEKRIFGYIPGNNRACSLETDIFPGLITGGEVLRSYYEEGAYWADVGSMVDFERVNDDYLARREPPLTH